MSVRDRIVRSSEENPYAVLIIVGLITIGMAYGVTQLSMSSEMEGFLPEEHTSVKVTNMVENEVGGTTRETILIEGENLVSSSSLRNIIRLKSRIAKDETFDNYIKKIQTFTDYIIPIVENRVGNWKQLSDRKLERTVNRLLSRPEIRKQTSSFLSENRNAALISITVNSGLDTDRSYDLTEKLDQIVDTFDEEHEDKAGLTGRISTQMATQDMMMQDLQILIPAAIIVVILVLYLVFRRLSDTILPFLVLGLGALWMVGTMGLLNIPFTMVYVALVPVLLGVGITYTIHLLNRYYEEREKGYNVEASSVRSVKTVGIAIALTAITTIIGFFSFGISSMPPIRNFGLFSGIGVLYVFVLTTTMLPSLIVLRDGGGEAVKQKKTSEGSSGRLEWILSKLEIGVIHHKKPLLAGALIVTVACAASAPGLSTSMSFNEFLPQDAESVQTSQRVGKYFGGQNMRSFVLVKGDLKDPNSLATIHSLQKSVQEDPESKELITNSASITDLVLYASGGSMPQSRAQGNRILTKLQKQRPDQVRRLLPGNNKALVYFTIDSASSKETKRAVELIRDHVDKFSNGNNGLKFTLNSEPAVGGSAAVITDVMNSIMPTMESSIILAVILVIIVLGLVFRSTKLGIIGCVPVVIALLWEFGAVRALGWSLNVMNMMVSALVIGIGVDFTIHVTHRFQEEWKEEASPENAISTTIQSVGGAVIAGASTIVGAFLVLSLSSMPPLAQFGQLSALVILFSLITALIVLPILLLVYAKKVRSEEES